LVAAVLCPFQRKATQANRLSKVALWTGLLALVAALVVTLGTTDVFESRPRSRAERARRLDAIFFVAATALPSLVGFLTERISGRKLEVLRKAVLPGWRRAHEALSLVLPGARMNAASDLTPATIFEMVDLERVVVDSGVIPQWEERGRRLRTYSNVELFDRIFVNAPIDSGEVIIVTDQCFPTNSREPFFCRGETLRQWILDHERFIFDDDVILIWAETRRITVFHHEGTFAHVRPAKPSQCIVNA
jgi:hypothetical protein